MQSTVGFLLYLAKSNNLLNNIHCELLKNNN
jgi:hypothetical protein